MEVTRNGIRYQVRVTHGELIVTPPMVGDSQPVPLFVIPLNGKPQAPDKIKKMARKALRGTPAPQPRA